MEINKYIISPKATNDIQKISNWYEEQSVDLAENFMIELRSKIRRLMKYPEMYKPVTRNVRRYKRSVSLSLSSTRFNKRY